MEDMRLGGILLESGLVAEADLERCLSIQALTGSRKPIGQILIEQGLVDAKTLDRVLELQHRRRGSERASTVPSDAMSASLLQAAEANGAAEMIVTEGRSVRIRVADRWCELTDEIVSGPEVWDFVREVVGPHALEEVAEHRGVVRSWNCDPGGGGIARVYRHFDGVGVHLTFVPASSDCEANGVPQEIVDLISNGRGLILLAGDRGPALRAVATECASRAGSHVLFLDEVPIPLSEGEAIVGLRRFGATAEERTAALRSAVHEDPDVLIVADVGDASTFEAALRAAEDGRLVIAHLDASSAEAALARILEFHAGYDVPRVCCSLAAVLRAVLVQSRLPRADGQGVAIATELLVVDEPVRAALRSGALDEVPLMMRMGNGSGHTMDQSILDLVVAGDVSLDDAFARAGEKTWLLERAQGGGA